MKNRFLTTFICIFIAAVLVLGGALGLATGIKSARAVAVCGNVTVDEGTANYLASYYKMLYIRSLRTAGVDASDSKAFWDSKSDGGVSYGELFESSFKDYLASLIAAADIYLSYSTYTADDKLRVAETCDEILKYKANGSVTEFNDTAEEYGFDFTDFQNAAALIYKARLAEKVIYGENGENMRNYPDLCEEFLKEYSHVSLIFIKTGGDLTASELAERQSAIETLTAAIEAKENGGDLQITPQMFEGYLANSDGDPVMYERGYYFRLGAEKTAEFASALPEVVEASLEMQIGEYRRTEYSEGVCFIYKYEPEEGAYDDKDNVFFSDFLADAATYHYDKVLSELIPTVTFRDRYSNISPLSVPVINDYYIREFK